MGQLILFDLTTAMTTMKHQYLATMLYSDETIQKVLKENCIIEVEEVTNPNMIKFRKYTSSIYKNQYEKEILVHDEDALYKVIEIHENTYHGFLVAVYDPSRIHLATTAYLGERGESILTVSERENAIIAMNAGGFYDPDWNSNGALHHGVVISYGQVVREFTSVGYFR